MEIGRRRQSRALVTILLFLLSSCGPASKQVNLGPCHLNARKLNRSETGFDIDDTAKQYEKEIIAAANAWNDANSSLMFKRQSGAAITVLAAPDSNPDLRLSLGLRGVAGAVTIERNIRGVVLIDTVINISANLTTDTPATGFDVQSITVHEAGHWVVFADTFLPDCEKTTVMFGRIRSRIMRRELTEQDKDAIRKLYSRF